MIHHHRRGAPYFFRLQRRLFASFGITIVVTAALVGGLLGLLSDSSLKQETSRLQRLVGGEFALVWHRPLERAGLAERIAKNLDAQLELRDAGGAVLEQVGPQCTQGIVRATVERDGTRLGEVRGCAEGMRPAAWRLVLPLLVIAMVLWMTAGRLSARILRPLSMVVRLAEDLGAGKTGARARMDCYRNGEERLVAESLNRMADRVERQLADQRELLAAVSHEMRTPLGHLRIIAEMARDGELDARAVGEIEKEIDEMDALVGDLLANSRLQFSTLSFQKIDGADLAARALERAGLPAALLAVEGEVAMEGDPTLLARALANLLENARRHGAGAVALSVRREPGMVCFAVEDQGPGLPAGDPRGVFEAFRRGHGSPSGSLGLGLNLVRRIARAHGGDAFAENRSEGGARVGFRVETNPPSTPAAA